MYDLLRFLHDLGGVAAGFRSRVLGSIHRSEFPMSSTMDMVGERGELLLCLRLTSSQRVTRKAGDPTLCLNANGAHER